jgi:hypothetical protein
MFAAPLIRLAGLPATVLRELRFHEVGLAVRDRLSLRRWVRAEGATLSDELYPVIARAAAHPARPLLVGLRRAVYQGRRPTAREWSPATRELLGRDLADRVERWVAACDEWRDGGRDLDERVGSETAALESRLRDLVSAPVFRRALLQASPDLSADLDKWLVDPGRGTRRLAPALVKYLVRAAAKTSPFSTFMVTGRGTWTDDDVAVRQCAEGLRGAAGVLDLGHVARSELHAALVTSGRLRRAMIIRVNPSVVGSGDRLRFLGPPPAEAMVTIDATPAISACLQLIPDAAITFGELAGKLEAAGNAQPARVAAFLDHLVEIGLLQLMPQPAGQITTPGEAGRWLRSLGAEFAQEGALLLAVDEAVRAAVPVEDVELHRRRLDAVGQAMGSLSGHLGQPITSQTFDTAVAGEPLAECGRLAWQPVLADLQVIRRWLALFSFGQDLKIALNAWWGQRPPTPFLSFYHELVKEIAGGSPAGKEIGRLWHSSGSGRASVFERIHELRALRQDAAGLLWRAAGPDGVVAIEPGELTLAVAGYPRWLDDLHAVGVYGQPLADESGPTFVINNIFTGYGRVHSRLDHLTGTRTEPWAQPPGDYPVFAALGGSLGTSLNVREPCAPYEITYPWHGDVRPGTDRIDLHDLWVERDPTRELLRLRSGRLDRLVRPLHLGNSVPWTLPRAAHLLVRAFGEEPPEPVMGIAPRGQRRSGPEVTVIPRARVGRVVVRRESRHMTPADIPARRANEPMAEYLLRLTAWRLEAGIPETCFVRGLASGRSYENKPLYLDFANPFLLHAFNELLRQPNEVVLFEEALPDPMRAPENHGGEHVMEMVIDVAAWGD